jgi:uncharacterized protein
MKIKFNITLVQMIVIALIAIALIMLEKESEAMGTNRLANEKSPYLLQHAENPVAWYPWCDEAFARAREEDKPVFLSIGYSTCHWCHVMERESFENNDIAQILNDNFIAIKVDREERPDIDHIYMNAVQMMTGSGGWPLSVFLTPEGKPFYGGTYFPPAARFGMPGFPDLLKAIAQAWQNDRANLLISSITIVKALENISARKEGPDKELSKDIVQKAYFDLRDQFDNEKGGFGKSQKFPMGHTLSFVLRYADVNKDKVALAMVTKTLNAIAAGGIYDHIGGGIHRYATDPDWRVPHFEKMLYDQALISRAYLEAYQVTHDELFATTARDIFDYVLRDMQGTNGGFYSAEDADSAKEGANDSQEKGEGAFYVWTWDELKASLTKDELKEMEYLYDVRKHGNVDPDPQGEFKDKNIMHQVRSFTEAADKFDLTQEELQAQVKDIKRKLFERRSQRPRPQVDDKVLTDWNGLMIASLAYGSRVLGDKSYLAAAEKAAQCILHDLVQPDGSLKHRWRDGQADIEGFLADYAFFISGLLELYEATFKIEYLGHAVNLAHFMVERYWDKEHAGFFMTASEGELIVRSKDVHDDALPSGNAVAALALIRLSQFTADPAWARYAERVFQASGRDIAASPSQFCQLLAAYQYSVSEPTEIVIAEGATCDRGAMFVGYLDEQFLPHAVRVLRPWDNAEREMVERHMPFLKDKAPVEGSATVFVCKDHACLPAVTTVEGLQDLLFPSPEKVSEAVKK